MIDLQEHFDATLLDLMEQLIQGRCSTPHAFLGLHPFFEEKKIIRLYRPGAREVFLCVKGEIVSARMIHPLGLFDCLVEGDIASLDYQVYHQNGLLAFDPYALSSFLGEVDAHLFNAGCHYQLYEKMGGRLREHEGTKGVSFAIWAPNALSVSVVGDFNFWDGRVNPMQSFQDSGIWELFIPGLEENERYKFEIKTKQSEVLLKADPFALASEHRPLNASIVADLHKYNWNDQKWLDRRRLEKGEAKPLNIYEVHLGSWKKPHDHFLNYRTLAHELSDYCLSMGYTHVELLPIQEHPLDESWGYQVSGFFATTSRYGCLEDFQYFVDHFHAKGLGVILDWVPAHFPSDPFALARFDGTCLFEHEDPRRGYHPHWNTLIFNYGRHEVSNFLIASALFWIEQMHVDGLRVDAVSSMLYLDYGRQQGDWIPNHKGGKENLEAIEWMRHLNSVVHERNPGVLMIAEESTSFKGVTKPLEWGGLGFDFKWNMGWMHDTLRYFQQDPLFRRYHQKDLTFGLLYVYEENFMNVFSHDEVVHGKRSLLSKMPGDLWQQFANLRLLLSYMMCQPGKKILFMGAEFGQYSEWDVKKSLDWHLLQYPKHTMLHHFVQKLNHLYLKESALWEQDQSFEGFEWVDFSDHDQSILSYLRRSQAEEIFCVHNFTPSCHQHYSFPLARVASIQKIFDSDDPLFGGSAFSATNPEIKEEEIFLDLPPLSTQLFKIEYFE